MEEKTRELKDKIEQLVQESEGRTVINLFQSS